MDAATKASILHGMIRRMGAGGADITTEDWLDFVEAQNDGYQTGPEIDRKVPDFTLVDQRRVTTSADLDTAAVQDVLHSIYRPMRSQPAQEMRVTFSLDLLLFRVT